MSELERLRWQLNVSWSLLSLHLERKNAAEIGSLRHLYNADRG
ncbi:hypothetical protein [Streptosporangium pseudovulgare]|uniref:Uncharacterized protein n=1 Tax=Streptosporangium pseudovulgare TaxID=35765 RepID=A0ABQ2QZJ6_9ACTN|nr:hypothetical protein [Streptosporangium pseudovulgare]GGQ05731.1 hypothetical protein GCM10010140_40090 [Streptosporangium pseudovulgare]